jgi:hypothetical protein
MYTVERLNLLRRHFGAPPVKGADILFDPSGGPPLGFTPYLNVLDKVAGIDTRCGRDCACRSDFTFGAVPCSHGAYVGERLARLERHVFGTPAPYYFWLGADGENPDRGRADLDGCGRGYARYRGCCKEGCCPVCDPGSD